MSNCNFSKLFMCISPILGCPKLGLLTPAFQCCNVKVSTVQLKLDIQSNKKGNPCFDWCVPIFNFPPFSFTQTQACWDKQQNSLWLVDCYLISYKNFIWLLDCYLITYQGSDWLTATSLVIKPSDWLIAILLVIKLHLIAWLLSHYLSRLWLVDC